MGKMAMIEYVAHVIEHMPSDWLRLTTHRLDIYNEKEAKVEFLEELNRLYLSATSSAEALKELPTAYDYIRLGHPLSCVLEWVLADLTGLASESLIAFSSQTTPLLSILRKNLFEQRQTEIVYSGDLPKGFDADVVKRVYGYTFDLLKLEDGVNLPIKRAGVSRICIATQKQLNQFSVPTAQELDFFLSLHGSLGSVLAVLGEENKSYISEIQHVRRRETIAMTPADCLTFLEALTNRSTQKDREVDLAVHKTEVLGFIKDITATNVKPLLGSSGLSVQYAIMMGLIDDALEQHPGKEIRIVVPPNCYGGTNDQARRVAACLNHVKVVDLPVDGDNDMVQSVELVLEQIALEDAVPYIIAEIPTNPRVEVPDLEHLKSALAKPRVTLSGTKAVDPVFILDQTFCPNVRFLSAGAILSTVRSISYSSGSKFPSGGLCTAGYCVANDKAKDLMPKIDLHMSVCDNEATALQYQILAEQMPSMLTRIKGAYENTREFVSHIQNVLPEAKINFVSEELAEQGFTPSVFSLDLPTKGSSDTEREVYKRKLNHRLIGLMISEIPNESKYCVSYGQLKGCYWTIPATSTQGTTKEGDKDYIARVAVSSDLDLEKHKAVFDQFVAGL
ncbi:MAG: cystathionine beta-synthase [Flavobacteriales bacterium]